MEEDKAPGKGDGTGGDGTVSETGGFIYLIGEREFMNTHSPVYKLGQTQKYDPHSCLEKYPKSSEVHLVRRVSSGVCRLEQQLKCLFRGGTVWLRQRLEKICSPIGKK